MWQWLLKLCCCEGKKEIEIHSDCEVSCKCCVKKTKQKIVLKEDRN